MLLTVLGCSGSGPGPEGPASGYLVVANGVAVTLDLGNGTFGALQRHLDPWALDAALLTHLHPDHCSDVSPLVVWRRYHPRPPFDALEQRLPVLAPAGAADRLAWAYAASRQELGETDLADVLDFRAITDGGSTAVETVTVRSALVDHPVEAYALRLEHGGRSLVYSGDTGPSAGLVELARGADVLLCEATWPHVIPGGWEEPPPGVHLSGRQAGEHAAAAGVGRLLLTHVPAWFSAADLLTEAKEAFDGPVEVVRPDASYEI
ncbi:MBL fold metallo-hydrolase [Pseudonocardia sp. CA-107938]|uniref:MBL fold metallo-hydrolase n=1 Tax=Pseudonocardia sp. CA-107938 TaxID=3240021 RepID=UPI003D8C92BF